MSTYGSRRQISHQCPPHQEHVILTPFAQEKLINQNVMMYRLAPNILTRGKLAAVLIWYYSRTVDFMVHPPWNPRSMTHLEQLRQLGIRKAINATWPLLRWHHTLITQRPMRGLLTKSDNCWKNCSYSIRRMTTVPHACRPRGQIKTIERVRLNRWKKSCQDPSQSSFFKCFLKIRCVGEGGRSHGHKSLVNFFCQRNLILFVFGPTFLILTGWIGGAWLALQFSKARYPEAYTKGAIWAPLMLAANGIIKIMLCS